MAKKILNMDLFNQNVSKVLDEQSDNTLPPANTLGLSNVVRYVWNHYPTSCVDFDSFTLDDLYNAKSQFYSLPEDQYDEDEQDSSFIQVDENGQPIKCEVNCWQENFLVENIIASLYNTKNLVYENDDDFI